MSLISNLIDNRNLIVILGPTASGKTELSLKLSKYLPIEIISADSRQVYRYLNIGTAKPNEDELKFVQHHFIDFLNPDEEFNSGTFGDLAEKKCNEIYSKGKIPVVVGGSGLYIKSLCEGLFSEENVDEEKLVRKELAVLFKENGIDPLYKKLHDIDNESAQLYSDKNPRRILRALEYYYNTGKKFSQSHKEKKIKRNFTINYFGIYFERESLYDRINIRTEKMWNSGLLQETLKVLNLGFNESLNSLNTVGYKETIKFINGIINEQEAIETIKMNTRRYAKRQMTWFGKIDEVTWIDGQIEDSEKIILKKLEIN